MKNAFSLIELLTVMAIVTILSLIAYPCYKHYIVRANRLAAETSLQALAGELEDYHLEHHSYHGAHASLQKIKDYSLSINKLTKNTFLISAHNKDETILLDEQGNVEALSAMQTQSSLRDRITH